MWILRLLLVCLGIWIAQDGFAQTTVSISAEKPVINDPEARIECPPGAVKRTEKTYIRELYPALEKIFPAPDGYQVPRMLAPPRAEFPVQLQMLGVTGFVSLAFIVNVDGSLDSSEVLCSNAPAFEMAALSSVPTMRFMPATQDGEPVLGIAIQPFIFDLSN